MILTISIDVSSRDVSELALTQFGFDKGNLRDVGVSGVKSLNTI